MARPTKAAFERSRFDNDKGVKEGSPADKARDKKQFPAFAKAALAPQFTKMKKGGRVGKGRGR
jgi:hypothetical protein